MAACTPSSRDRYVDFLRAFSIVVVVIGHWISTMVVWDNQGITGCNAVGVIPGMWVATWILQVMPLFFFIGGFSNLITFNALRSRGEPLRKFYRIRLVRLLKPTIVFIGFILLLVALLIIITKDWTRFTRASIGIVMPLWFLAVYLIVIMVTPVMRELHNRFRIIVPIVSVVLVVAVDSLRFGFRIPYVAWLNVLFVWLFVHQLGFFYGDGSLLRLPKWVYALITAAGLGSLIVLTNIGVYPRSMVGTGFEKISNMNPPTICIVALTLWLVGLAMLLRMPLNRWLNKQRPWMAVIAANTMIMTLYLWHLTAFAIAFIILYPTGLGHQPKSIPLFWLERPVWIIVPGIILTGLVAIFARFERPARVAKKEG